MSIRHGLRGKIVTAGAGHHKSSAYTDAVRKHMEANGEHHGFEHARWRDVSDKYKQLPSFACIRNPWARTASRYFFGLQVAKQGKPESKNYNPKQTFDEFLEERHRWGSEPYYWHRGVRGWYPQLDYVTDLEGKIRCDILRTEHLNEDLRAYAGWELPPRRRNVSQEAVPYHEIYEDRQIQIVGDWYAADIEYFGFDFDHAATRNYFR